MVSEPVEKNGEAGQRDADRRGVARIVEASDRQTEVIERGQRVAVRPIYRAGSAGTSALMSSPCRSLTVSETSK
jgi:hypothetical protein